MLPAGLVPAHLDHTHNEGEVIARYDVKRKKKVNVYWWRNLFSLNVKRWQMIKSRSSVTIISDSGYVIKFHFDFQLVEHKSILPSLILTLSIPYGISNHDS